MRVTAVLLSPRIQSIIGVLRSHLILKLKSRSEKAMDNHCSLPGIQCEVKPQGGRVWQKSLYLKFFY